MVSSHLKARWAVLTVHILSRYPFVTAVVAVHRSWCSVAQAHPWFRGIDWENIHRYPAPYRPELKNPEDTRHFDEDIPAEVSLESMTKWRGADTALTHPASRTRKRCGGGCYARSAVERQSSRQQDPGDAQSPRLRWLHTQEPPCDQLRPSGQSVRSRTQHVRTGRRFERSLYHPWPPRCRQRPCHLDVKMARLR